MKSVILFLILFLTAKNSIAEDKTGMAGLIWEKVQKFKAAMNTTSAEGMPGLFMYTVNLGSGQMDTTDFCFRICMITCQYELEHMVWNYYVMMEGRPVLLYLNHPSMLYLVKALDAKEIDKINIEKIRDRLLNGYVLFEYGRPYQVCCKKDGVVSGDIISPHYQELLVKPDGVPIKQLPSLSR